MSNILQRYKEAYVLNFKKWIKAAGIRALKTVAQTAIALIPAGIMISEVNWITVGSTALLAGVLSLLTSIVGLPELDEDKTKE